jgi:dihydroorotase
MATWATIAERMSTAPARIGRIKEHGSGLIVGANANIILVDTSIQRKVSEIRSVSRSTNNPYVNRMLPGQVLYTFLHGELIVSRGELVRPL